MYSYNVHLFWFLFSTYMTDERDKTTNEETLEGKEEAIEEETMRRRKEKANRKRKKQRNETTKGEGN